MKSVGNEQREKRVKKQTKYIISLGKNIYLNVCIVMVQDRKKIIAKTEIIFEEVTFPNLIF